MGVEGDLIWGDDDESEVFAKAQNHDLCLIFRYSLHPKLPQSLPNRIVNCFHCLPVNDTAETFSDREKMREALYTSIRRVWNQCANHPSITTPDVTVERTAMLLRTRGLIHSFHTQQECLPHVK